MYIISVVQLKMFQKIELYIGSSITTILDATDSVVKNIEDSNKRRCFNCPNYIAIKIKCNLSNNGNDNCSSHDIIISL